MATLEALHMWRPKLRGKYIAYLRSSQLPYSRLNLRAQRAAIAAFTKDMPVREVNAFTEIEPLIDGQRPKFEEAIEECEAQNAILIFGKLDRMRRNVQWLEKAYEKKIQVAAADLPRFAFDEYMKLCNARRVWRLQMSERVSEALAAAKMDGKALGGSRGNSEILKLGPAASAAARRRTSLQQAERTMREIELLRHRGITKLEGLAKRLNQMGHKAPRGGQWSATQVARVINRCDDCD